MRDRLEIKPGLVVGERRLGQRAPRESSVGIEDAFAESFDELLQRRLPGLYDGSRDLVGVDDDGAARGKQLGNSGLSGSRR